MIAVQVGKVGNKNKCFVQRICNNKKKNWLIQLNIDLRKIDNIRRYTKQCQNMWLLGWLMLRDITYYIILEILYAISKLQDFKK